MVTPALEQVVNQAIALRERKLDGLGASLYQSLSRWWQLQSTLHALNRLDDRELADIGLQRDGLRDLVESRLRQR
jgi:uncharacterized protein YjiS (DUF1127 family)